MKKIYKNWFVHNVLGHPLAELVYWVLYPFDATKAMVTSMKIHDGTCPDPNHSNLVVTRRHIDERN